MKDKLRELLGELMSACEMIGYATSGNERANHRANRDKIKDEFLAILDAEGDGESVDGRDVRLLLECVEGDHGGDHFEADCRYCVAFDKLTAALQEKGNG